MDMEGRLNLLEQVIVFNFLLSRNGHAENDRRQYELDNGSCPLAWLTGFGHSYPPHLEEQDV